MDKTYLMKDLKLLRDFGILGLILIVLLASCEVYFTVFLTPPNGSISLHNGTVALLFIISGLLLIIIITLSLILFRNKRWVIREKQINDGDINRE